MDPLTIIEHAAWTYIVVYVTWTLRGQLEVRRTIRRRLRIR